MRRLKKPARWLGLTIALGVVAFFVVRNYLIRVIIIQQIEKQYNGRVELGDWWLNGTSAGVTGLALGESTKPGSPTWVSVDRISADVSLGGLLRGKYLPTKIEVEHPRLSLEFAKDGNLATPIPIKLIESPGKGQKAAESFPIPEVIINHAELSLGQTGKPPLTIASAHARLFGEGGDEKIEATTDDPVWGNATVTGHFNKTFSKGSVTLATAPRFSVDTEDVKKVPFVPAEVWDNVAAKGPVDGTVKISLDQSVQPPMHVLTKLKLNGVWAKLVPLQVETTETTGQIVIDDAKVEVNHIRGKAIDGTIRAAGLLDFSKNPPDLNVDLRLKGINVEKTPAAWQLDELGATGTMTGRVDLRVRLGADRIDLTGTSGNALIENGSFQSIPIKELSVNLTAKDGDLQFETTQGNTLDRAALEAAPTVPTPRPLPPMQVAEKPAQAPLSTGDASIDSIASPILSTLSLARIMTGDNGFMGFVTFVAAEVIEHQTNSKVTPGTSKLRLPKTITTNIEIEDVDLKTILDKAEKFGIKVGFPISGRLTVKATATLPLATLRDIRAYKIHGDASLTDASIDYVDVGEVAVHLDVENGVVNLSDLRGVLINRPEDDIDHLPVKVAIPTREGELPPGGFRGDLRAEVEPRGTLSARFRGEQLPLGELFAPFLPVPTPLSGDLTIHTKASVNLASLTNPLAYHLEGDLESHSVNFKGAKLDLVSTRFGVKDGRASISEFSAMMADRPMSAEVGLNLSPPYAFNAKGNVGGWQIANILGFVPDLPPHPEIAGRLDANLDAGGTLFPFAVQTHGGARVAAIKVGSFLSRYIVFEWRTEDGVVHLKNLEAALFGGKLIGDARVPMKLDKKLEVNLVLKGIDTRKMTEMLPSKGVAITGIADGRVKVNMPLNLSTVDAEINLSAPNLSFRPENRYGEGIKVQELQIIAQARDRLITYEANANSLGAKLSFNGSIPIEPDPTKSVAQAEARVVGFQIGDAWRGLGMSGGLAELAGAGTVVANLRGSIEPPELWMRGLFNLDSLRYGPRFPIGQLNGQVAVSPTAWKLERLDGNLFGGVATGNAAGEMKLGTLGQSSFNFRVDRASVPKLLALAPDLAKGATGYGSLRASGRLDDALRLTANLTVPHAKVLNLTLTDVRMPANVNINPKSGVGLVQARRWTGRLAGGLLQGNSWMRLGSDRSFQSDLKLVGVDLEVLARIGAISSKASGGKLSGTLSINGPDPTELRKMRGRFNFDINDATLVALPVFRELGKFLGGSRGGGLFDEGEVRGNIGNETLYIEQCTLSGRMVQIHAIGSVTFKGNLNLEVLVNTNQQISQSGMTLLNVIPGLSEVLGQSEKVLLKLTSFLSSRLLKFRVTGNIQNPTVTIDPSVDVGDSAVGFFSSALKLPGDK